MKLAVVGGGAAAGACSVGGGAGVTGCPGAGGGAANGLPAPVSARAFPAPSPISAIKVELQITPFGTYVRRPLIVRSRPPRGASSQ
jgi:hypothetical protein